MEDLISRPYQVALEEIASKRNTIIHLPTGSGKTYIAICLIRRFGKDLILPWGKGGKRTFFLVNTVPLVTQQQTFGVIDNELKIQKKVLEQLCPVKGVGAYSGEDGVDYWNKDKWDMELEKNEVIVMTSQILCDMLTHQYINIEDINLIIFDECHHAVDDHPMRLIMRNFENCPVEDQPRVLGLTATLLNGNVSMGVIQNTLRDLEKTFHATIATVNELGEVLTYSTNPREFVQSYSECPPTAAACLAIERLVKLQELIMSTKLPQTINHELKLKAWQMDITTDPKKIVKAVKNMVVSMATLITEMGIYGGALGILAYIILLERLRRKATTKEEEDLYKFTVTHCLEARMILLLEMKGDSGYQQIVKHSSPKILQMLDILKEYNPKTLGTPIANPLVNHASRTLSAIIFTQQRFTAKVLYNLLKDVVERNRNEFGFLKHDFVVGFQVNPMKCTREQSYLKKASQKALLDFKRGELNCLISTSVIEEGVDIPQCLLVLRYDPPLEYRSYIQSKGRARNKDSSYVIMISKNNHTKFMKSYRTFNEIEQYIQGMLVGNTDNRDAPSKNDIENEVYKEDIPPYVAASGARLSAISAISLLNRYFSMLPHDQFTVITPAWVQETEFLKGHKFIVVSIILPLACPIKEVIKGTPQPTVKDAKRSAALEACKKLHMAGELDEVTLLPKKYASVDFDEADISACFPNWPQTNAVEVDDEDGPKPGPKPGSKKTIRKHHIAFPKLLKSDPGDVYYLHIIQMKPAFQEPKKSREKCLFDFIKSKQGYGILTQKPLPKVCPFSTYVKIGEINTEMEMNYAVIKLNEDLFDLVKRFHFFIFDQVLAVAKKFITFEGLENCTYVVPIKGNDGYDIDWAIMQKHKTIEPVTIPDVNERKSLQVTNDNYLHAVVTPWYRGTILPDRYIVTKVLEFMSPQSLFGESTTQTYADYFSNKYCLDVLGDKNQPLLEVQNITTGMNCLLARAATIRAFTEKQKKLLTMSQGDDTPRGFEEIFVAEFCQKFDYPGVLWYKATMLPSIIHRVYQMLVAHELMTEISNDIKYGTPVLSKTEKWLPIQDDMEVVKKSLLAQIEGPGPSNSIDRMNPSTGDTPTKLPKIGHMRESLYQLQRQKINKEYPWDEQKEPIDIERNLSTVTLMDIECYDEFVSAPMESLETVRSPPRFDNASSPTRSTAALKPPPLKYIDKIKILEKKPEGRGPQLRDVVSALTTIKSHDSFCLERAETLGDSFLKFAATLYLYHKFPQKNEGQLTNIKCKLISNRNLYYAGERINLGGRMKIEPFAPRKDFLVPGFFVPKEVEEFIREKKIRPTFLIGTYFTEYEAISGELFPETIYAIHQKYEEGEANVEKEPEYDAQNAMQCYLHTQALGDKSVADCVEALIGTYLLSGGILAAVKILEWLRVIPAQDKLSEILNKKVDTVISLKKATASDIHFLMDGYHDRIEEIINYKFKDPSLLLERYLSTEFRNVIPIEDIINYKFKDPSLLLEAFTHPSYMRNRLTRSYERLEFLGDAILDFLITAHIFENSTDLKPGDLTDLRSSLVNNVTFASYVVKLGLHKFICKEFNPVLDKAVMEFVEHQTQRGHEIVEDVLYLIDEKDCQVAEYVEVPKVLSDVFESLAGAIYLDTEGDLQAVWSVIYPIMCAELDAFSMRIPRQPVAVLYEKVHTCPKFCTPIKADADMPKMFVPVKFTKDGVMHTVYGVGNNKSQAKRAGAKIALKILAI